MPERQITITVDATPDGAAALFGSYVGLMKRLFPDSATTWRMLHNASTIVRCQEDADFQDAIEAAIYHARKD